MAYNKREFIQQAAIQIGAAMVKVMDETTDGIMENPFAFKCLSRNAVTLAMNLADMLEEEYLGDKGETVFDEEI